MKPLCPFQRTASPFPILLPPPMSIDRKTSGWATRGKGSLFSLPPFSPHPFTAPRNAWRGSPRSPSPDRLPSPTTQTQTDPREGSVRWEEGGGSNREIEKTTEKGDGATPAGRRFKNRSFTACEARLFSRCFFNIWNENNYLFTSLKVYLFLSFS